jgi:hypothetical protein
MAMDRVRRWLPDWNPTLEIGLAVAVGFLAGRSFDGEWPLLGSLVTLLLGG